MKEIINLREEYEAETGKKQKVCQGHHGNESGLGSGQTGILRDATAPTSDRYMCVYICTAAQRASCHVVMRA